MEEFVLSAKPRAEFGSKVARRLRDEGLLPAMIYGHKEANVAVSLNAKEFEAFFKAGHRVATIVVDGNDEHGVIKEVQYDSLCTTITHVDFTRISADETIVLEVPIEIVGVPHGVSGGGVLDFRMKELRMEAPPRKMPESYQLNVEAVTLGSVLRVKDLEAPEGCRILDAEDAVVISVGQAQEEPEAPAAEPGPSEPEVIGRKKEDDTEEDAK